MNNTVVKVGEKGLGGTMAVPPQAEGIPPHWGVYVTVYDVDATAAKAEDLGGKVLVPPSDIPTVGRFSVLQDPQEAEISAITAVMIRLDPSVRLEKVYTWRASLISIKGFSVQASDQPPAKQTTGQIEKETS